MSFDNIFSLPMDVLGHDSNIKDSSSIVLRTSAFVVQYVSWMFTLGAFCFTGLGFLGVKRMMSLRDTEDNILKQIEELKKEHDSFRKSVARFKETRNVDFAFTKARIFYLQGQYEDTWSILQIMPDDHSYELCLYKGLTLSKRNDYKDAISMYLKALKMPNADKARIFYNIANNFRDQKIYDEAISHYDKAIEESVNYLDAYIDKAISLRGIGNLKEAIIILEKVIKMDGKMVRAYYNQACYLSLIGEESDAVDVLEKAIDLNADKYKKLAEADPDFQILRENKNKKYLELIKVSKG